VDSGVVDLAVGENVPDGLAAWRREREIGEKRVQAHTRDKCGEKGGKQVNVSAALPATRRSRPGQTMIQPWLKESDLHSKTFEVRYRSSHASSSLQPLTPPDPPSSIFFQIFHCTHIF
jgi:hypothetical protein